MCARAAKQQLAALRAALQASLETCHRALNAGAAEQLPAASSAPAEAAIEADLPEAERYLPALDTTT
jgi:hypothetical protein